MAYETITIPNVELFATGQHNEDFYDLDDLRDMEKNFHLIQTRPIVKIGHSDDQNWEWPSLGYISSIKVVGNKLIGTLSDVPAKLGALIKSGAYGRQRSAEIFWNFKDGSGRVYRRVLKAISLLGSSWQAVDNLKPINLSNAESLYGRSDTSGICYDARGQCYKRHEIPLKRAQIYTIKKSGAEFHVVSGNGLVMGAHTDLLSAEKQRRELSK